MRLRAPGPGWRELLRQAVDEPDDAEASDLLCRALARALRAQVRVPTTAAKEVAAAWKAAGRSIWELV